MKIEIDSLNDIKHLFENKSSTSKMPYEIGKKYFIRAVTFHYIGEVKEIYNNEILVLKNASWIAESGRFNAALATGELSEVEPYINDVFVHLSAIVDATEWTHDLPMEVK